jgi:putative transposase
MAVVDVRSLAMLHGHLHGPRVLLAAIDCRSTESAVKADPRVDRGSQYTAIRYTDTLAAAGAVASVGSVGDSYDNALAESTIGQIKAELIHRGGPWRTVSQLEFAIFEYLDWWNHRRLHGELGMITPAEKEIAYYPQQPVHAEAGSQ